jgi:hypothetical protein
MLDMLVNSTWTIRTVPRKRKVVGPDTSTTSFERSTRLSLIENVDIGEFIEDLRKTKVPLSAYHCIQKNSQPRFLCRFLFYPFNPRSSIFFLLIFFGFLFFRLEWAILVQTPNLRFTRALIYSL